jgi:hypothetical protein
VNIRATPGLSPVRSLGKPEIMSAAAQATPASSIILRWYRLAVVVLGVALTAAITLAVYLAVTRPATTSQAGSGPATTVSPVSPAPGASQPPCYRPHIPC